MKFCFLNLRDTICKKINPHSCPNSSLNDGLVYFFKKNRDGGGHSAFYSMAKGVGDPGKMGET